MTGSIKDQTYFLKQHRNFGYQLKEIELPPEDRKMKMVGNQDLMLPDIYSPARPGGYSEAGSTQADFAK